MDYIESEPLRSDSPPFADKLIGRHAFEGLQPSPKIVGVDEVIEVIPQLIMGVVVEALDDSVPDRPVDALDLAIRQRVFDCGQPGNYGDKILDCTPRVRHS